MNTHRNFLIDLITALDRAGFTEIRVEDPVFDDSTYLADASAEKLAAEVLDIDDITPLHLTVPDTGHATLMLLWANAPFETVMDIAYSNNATLAAVSAVLDPIAKRYEEL